MGKCTAIWRIRPNSRFQTPSSVGRAIASGHRSGLTHRQGLAGPEHPRGDPTGQSPRHDANLPPGPGGNAPDHPTLSPPNNFTPIYFLSLDRWWGEGADARRGVGGEGCGGLSQSQFDFRTYVLPSKNPTRPSAPSTPKPCFW